MRRLPRDVVLDIIDKIYLGDTSALATYLEVSASAVRQWMTGSSGIKNRYRKKIEELAQKYGIKPAGIKEEKEEV